MGIPRTSIQYWLKRLDKLDASPVVKAFFESPEGLAFLHRLVMAARVTRHPVGTGESVRGVAVAWRGSEGDWRYSVEVREAYALRPEKMNWQLLRSKGIP